MKRSRPIVIGHHIILTGYGHWLPNDPRGSNSDELRNETLEEFGAIHHGRKQVQPSRDELRDFYERAVPKLKFAPLWFDGAKRQAVATVIAGLAAFRPYTLWACAVLRNHVHLCVRRHRNDGEAIWRDFAAPMRDALLNTFDIDPKHPVWSLRPYSRFLDTRDEVRAVVEYIRDNPEKEGLPRQNWPFVTHYDGWPHR